MSRVGKLPVAIPSGVKCAVNGRTVVVEGPKGKLQRDFPASVNFVVADGNVQVSISKTDLQARADYGTARSHVNNMIKGVSIGWKRGVELNGVGFVAKQQGNSLVLSVGYSHDVTLPIPSQVKCTINKNLVEFESADKETLGMFVAKVRMVHPPEPYLGKGIRYTDEVVRRKAGKTGKK